MRNPWHTAKLCNLIELISMASLRKSLVLRITFSNIEKVISYEEQEKGAIVRKEWALPSINPSRRTQSMHDCACIIFETVAVIKYGQVLNLQQRRMTWLWVQLFVYIAHKRQTHWWLLLCMAHYVCSSSLFSIYSRVSQCRLCSSILPIKREPLSRDGEDSAVLVDLSSAQLDSRAWQHG